MAFSPQNTNTNTNTNTISAKLASFIAQNKIPHILFHGPSGSGKRTLVYKFVDTIYNNDKQLIKNYTMFADCAHGKGIKFIREELKFFAKTNINIQGSGHFKTIVLTNADKLTTDAQSALRRCIELFSHNTRFFIIVENKYNLLKPILSRLCDLFIGGGGGGGDNQNPLLKLVGGEKNNKTQSSGGTKTIKQNKTIYPSGGTATPNYYKQNIAKLLDTSAIDKLRRTYLETEFNKLQDLSTSQDLSTLQDLSPSESINNTTIVKLVNKLYEKSYSGLDLMNYIESLNYIVCNDIDDNQDRETAFLLRKYKLLIYFHKVKAEFRNEKIFMTCILTFFFVRSNSDLENISFM